MRVHADKTSTLRARRKHVSALGRIPVLAYPPSMALGDRIKAARKAAGLSQVELAQRLRIGQTTISKWERGESEPDRSQTRELELTLGLSAYALDASDGLPERRKLPVMGYIGAGQAVEKQPSSFPLEYIDAPPGAPDDAVCAIVRGTSMLPFLRPDNVILWWRWFADPRPLLGEPVICELEDETVLVKQVEPGSRYGVWNLVSLNATEPTLRDVRLRGVAPIEIILRTKDWRR